MRATPAAPQHDGKLVSNWRTGRPSGVDAFFLDMG
jgi:hypothetical protein